MRVAGSMWLTLVALALALSASACRVDQGGLGTFGRTPGTGGAGGIGGIGIVTGNGGASGGGGSAAGGSGPGGSGAGGGGTGGSAAGGSGPGGGGGTSAGGNGGNGNGGNGNGGNGNGGNGNGGNGGGGEVDASSVDSGNRVDAAPETGAPDTRPSVVGCADGTREGYLNTTPFPNIAACAGGWDVPGLFTQNTRVPACNRRAGNTGAGTITDGAGCTVADLCAEGWHVCESGVEVSGLAGGCDGAIGAVSTSRVFYVTRQRSLAFTCSTANDVGANNLHGCGTANYGVAELASCAPFEFSWSHGECDDNAPWECGTDPNDMVEGNEVVKPGAARGGALCCRD